MAKGDDEARSYIQRPDEVFDRVLYNSVLF
jgi:hypothetical protein